MDNLIDYTDFAKVEFRIGQILEVIEVEGSEKLLRMVVDFGEEKRVVFSGIKRWYSPADLLNRKTVFVTNMKPKKIMGEESGAMIFGAEDETGEKMSILLLDKDLPVGAKVF